MIILWLALLIRATVSYEFKESTKLTTHNMLPIDRLEHVAGHGDAQHRGSSWYGESSQSSKESEAESGTNTGGGSSVSSYSIADDSSSASSFETSEKKKATRTYRVCTPCYEDLMKSYRNLGIKWICAGYQRARRSFKSECMMRYRNCEDGTMFVKIRDHRCPDDVYHGRHFFYDYKV